MSWLSDLFGGDSGPSITDLQWQAYNAEIERQRQEQYAIAAENERRRLANIDESNRLNAAAAGLTAPPGGVGVTDNLPAGFESSYIPAGLTKPFEESAFTGGRTKAEDFINTLLKRGTLTETGGAKARSLLTEQEPGVRQRLADVGNVLLENERAKLRGIGRTQADIPAVAGEAATFQAGLPAAYTAALPAGDLFSTATLPASAGAVSGTQISPQLDPYAQEGGKLSTGLEEVGAPPPGSKKRTTAVF